MKPLHAQKQWTFGKCVCCIRYRHPKGQASYKGGNASARFKIKQLIKKLLRKEQND